jgi:hypothetical protein
MMGLLKGRGNTTRVGKLILDFVIGGLLDTGKEEGT